MKDSVTYQAIVEEGKIKSARTILVDLGQLKFGLPTPATKQLIETIQEFEQLRSLCLKLLDVNSWQELLA